MDQISGLSQKCPDFSKIMSGILDPRIPTFWNSVKISSIYIDIKTCPNLLPYHFFQKTIKMLRVEHLQFYFMYLYVIQLETGVKVAAMFQLPRHFPTE